MSASWTQVTLKDVAFINPNEKLSKGTVAKKFTMERLVPFSKKLTACSIEEYKGGSKFRNGDTLVARITPCLENGKTAYVDCLDANEVAFGSTEFIVVRNIDSRSDSEFLYYFTRSQEFRDVAILSMTGSSGRQRVQLDVVTDHLFEIPCLRQQREIARLLGCLDDKIDLLHRQNKTLEAIAETLFRQWFVEEATDDWRIVTFAEHFDAFRGLSYKGSGLTECGLGTPMHNLNSVYEGGGYKEAGIKYYSGDFKERHVVDAGDVIVTNTEQGHGFRLIGFPAIVPKYFGKTGIFSQHIYRVVPKDTTYLTRDFLYHLIKENDVREQIISATNGSTVNMLAIDGLQRPTFRLPPEALVLRFDEIASEAREKRELNHNTIRNLEKLRDTLLPKLMSGEVRVPYE